MANVRELYNSKKVTAAEAVTQVRNNDYISVPTAAAEPPTLLRALSDARKNYQGVKVMQILALQKYGYLEPETADHVRHHGFFLSGATRPGWAAGVVDVIPNYFFELPALMREGAIPVDVVFTLASPMDQHGYFSLSLGADYTMAAIEKARAVVLEVNPNVPYAYGECKIHISQVAALVESEDPLLEVPLPKVGPLEEKIAAYVADLVEDGSTLQIGYGTIPDAVVMQLQHKKNLGIHTEMIGDGIMSLVESGAVTNQAKNFGKGKMYATFALGSKKLHQFMDRNPMLEMHPVDFTNDPYIAGQNDKLISINGTLEVDFAGQCCSESMGPVPFSGTGGQADFVRAANRSKGGKSFIVTPSTAKGGTISRITPMLKPGSVVSTTKNDVNYVVTEYGVAHLRGKSLKQRAEALIAIAHPDFRGELKDQAKKMGLL